MTNIHIHAECPYFSIFEIVPEKKAVARLRTIRRMFLSQTQKAVKKGVEKKLSVKTGIHNPTLF